MTQALQKTVIYAALLAWAFVCLFPIYWTVTTAFKEANDIRGGDLIPWLQFEPNWKGWESLGLSPDTITRSSSARQLFLKHGANTVMSLAERRHVGHRHRLAGRHMDWPGSRIASDLGATMTFRSGSFHS